MFYTLTLWLVDMIFHHVSSLNISCDMTKNFVRPGSSLGWGDSSDDIIVIRFNEDEHSLSSILVSNQLINEWLY